MGVTESFGALSVRKLQGMKALDSYRWHLNQHLCPYRVLVLCFCWVGCVSSVWAVVLPEEKVEVLYHHYAETGQDINGPAVLVQKRISKKYSLTYSHLVDRVTGASVDVRLYASPYTETRQQDALSATHLFSKGTLSVGLSQSTENDFDARSAFWQLSQETFGGMTTVNLGFSRGWDEIGRRNDTAFSETADRWQYRIGVSQVLTPSLVTSVTLETITDQGFLNNPYRQVRYLDAGATSGFSLISEEYPDTRTSYALSIFTQYYVEVPGAVGFHYRYFTDSWAIAAHQFALKYNQPWRDVWEFEARFRWYTQDGADFFSDLFPFGSVNAAERSQNFQARDKELSDLTSLTVGLGVTYTLKDWGGKWADDLLIHFFWDRLMVDYDNYREVVRGSGIAPGSEPFYQLDANIFRVFFTLTL